MTQTRSLVFKIADGQSEFEQIHRLNYQAFVVEIPQHPPNAEELLVDRFHSENTYVICKSGDLVLGMIAIRERRPFSLDQKLEDLESFLPEYHAVCELRLLAVSREHRNSRVFQGLLLKVCEYCEGRGYDLAVMSGTVKQLRLYRQLGFEPFGPLVGSGEALFQPMYLTLNAYQILKSHSKTFLHLAPPPDSKRGHMAFLPGPAAISQPVRQAFGTPPISHRSKAFMEEFAQTKQSLCRLVGARHAEIFLGSGTLANDVVAGQLSLISGTGLVLSNGEFGNRLIDHAARLRLRFRTLKSDWGQAFHPDALRKALKDNRNLDWLWAVHCETSSGVLNDIELLSELCAPRGIRLCLDCISSIGNVPLDLSEIYLASGVSGKGLAGFPGLSFVFYNHEIVPAQHALPRYLDLALYAACDGVPFTTSSNLIHALSSAVQRFEPERFQTITAVSSWLRSELVKSGFKLIGTSAANLPAVTTIELPESISSEWVGRKLNEAGYQLSYRSHYLREHNWIQICLMGEVEQESLVPLLAVLCRLCSSANSHERKAQI
jgi:aspartate aminotransferase-like enzyme/ribosomal protein S18 acetylase RimI-like enzyme